MTACALLRTPSDADPLPDRATSLSPDDFLQACEYMASGGYTWQRDPAEAYRHFRGWRANYEDLAYAIAREIDAVPAPWSGPRTPPLPVIAADTQPNRSPDRPEGTGRA